MAEKGKRTIHAGGVEIQHLMKVEGKAVAATLPGLLVSESAAGLVIGADVGKNALVADMDNLKGLTVDDAWVINQNMVSIQPTSGVFLNVRLGASQTIAKGDPLKDSGNDDGYVVSATLPADAAAVVCYADEAVATGAGDAGAFIRARFV